MAKPEFRMEFDPAHGEAISIAKDVQRITANNGGPFTFHGTNTYIVGDKNVAVIDPGPEADDAHLGAIMNALKGRTLSHIIVTHTHMDHSPLSRKLAALTGAPTYGEGEHRASRDLHIGEHNPLDGSADREFEPDVVLSDGDIIKGEGWSLEAIFTPGHTANHMTFSLLDTDMMFSGDHVMAWATTIVAPPDGSMSDYMASLEILAAREESVYFPGHGGRLNNAPKFVRALKAHRKMRETAVLARIRKGDETIPDIVKIIYKSTDPKLHGAAGLSVLAHIEDLIARGKITSDQSVSINGRFFPVDEGN
ncbi:MAG: MBL fold metallo-hydrolase [Rhizobiaceae bacterium]